MKAITLWDPWASLIALGEKKVETRSWRTDYRGPLAIHAAKRPMDKIAWKEPFYSALSPMMLAFYSALSPMRLDHELPSMIRHYPGCIVATCWLMYCLPIIGFDEEYQVAKMDFKKGEIDCTIMLGGKELAFGDYTVGRYAWYFNDIKPLVKPIPAKGFQRLWNWDERREDDMEERTK